MSVLDNLIYSANAVKTELLWTYDRIKELQAENAALKARLAALGNINLEQYGLLQTAMQDQMDRALENDELTIENAALKQELTDCHDDYGTADDLAAALGRTVEGKADIG